MTSDEIKAANNLDSQYFWLWLKECAYQLAVMNERNASGDESMSPAELTDDRMHAYKRIGQLERELAAANQHMKILQESIDSLGSRVPPDSDSALRRDRCVECSHIHQQSGHCGAPIKLWKGYDPNMATWDECGCFSGPARPASGPGGFAAVPPGSEGA
jgi:hypothetical protein